MPEVKFAIDLCWDARRDRDPGQKWFRTFIKSVFREELSSAAQNYSHGVIPIYGSSTIEPTL